MIFILGMVASALNAEEVTIGAGDQQARVPMDFYWKNSLFECLYYPDELGFVSGTINALQFYNNFATNSPNGATKIWLGSTQQADLSAGWIPSTQLTLVYDGTVNYPGGANTINIPLTTPYMHTAGNLVMMVLRPMDGQWYSSSDNFQAQTIGTTRARKVQSDSTTYDPANPPATSTLSGQFPKTTIFYTGQAITNDLGCLSITGNLTPSVGGATPYTITIKNNGSATQTNYQVKLMKEGDVEIGSVNGTSIASMATMSYEIPWTPTATGATYLYGKVVMTGDEIAQNNQTSNLNVVVQAQGIVAVTVGTGGSTGRMPMDMYYKNSLFETVYLASELNIGGLLTGIQFYNNFATNLPSMPTNIWVGETTQTDLAAGWIPSTQLTQVFSGNVDYPSGANNILIQLTTPFPYGGGNMVVMVQRPMDTDWYSSSDVFVTQTVGTSRTLNAYSDSTPFDPTAPPTATPTGMFPKTTFMFITDGMGALNGTVYGPGNVPLDGASVTVAQSTLNYTTTATGTYSFPYIAEGTHQVTATKHGYTSVTNTVNIVEDQTTTQNFTLALLPQVTVTGRIVGSDAPTVGIAGATINLTGYEPYSATTNATGNFTIPNVFASQTYQYSAMATGYQPATGDVVVGTTNVNMGDIIVNEMAYPPYGVVATENDTFTQVNLTWTAPNPNAVDITEGFEADTFPPTDWTQVITDTSAPGTTGVYPTWCRVGEVALTPPVPAHGGSWQSGLWWSYNHQDEWLITPQFTCPPNAELNFWSYVFLGSTNGDHYYVKCSVDNGATWTDLWDASALTGGWNYYATPINIPLAAYSGQQIKLAFHADDPPSNDGLWYVWFIDDIVIGMPDAVMTFPADQFTTRSASGEGFAKIVTPNLPASRAMVNNPKLQEPALSISAPENPGRTLLGYKVWRLLAANQDNPALWTQLTPNNITPTNYTDTAWGPLPSGVYKFAVRAVYTNNVMSNAAFSNEIHKGMMGVLTGTVTEFGTNVPIAGATITAGDYSGTSNAQGVYNISVYAGTYNVTCAKPSYQTATQNGVVIVGLQTTTQNFVLTEITLPAAAVQAVEVAPNVNVTWMAPGTAGGEWIHYDSGENDDSIGTGAAADFDVAIRFPASELADYIGMSLYALKVWPAQAGTFSLRVWTGGTPDAPGTMVVDQPFTPTLDVYNTVLLTNPVTITGAEELWFGYRCNVTSGYPAGCDAGPATDGFGNMMYFQGEWSTLLELAPSLNYNWNIQGYVGYSAPTAAPAISPITLKSAYPGQYNDLDRTLMGYKVWRLLQGQESNETNWTELTANPISATAYQDTGWGSVPDGTYKWSVKAIYTGGAASIPAFSNAIPKDTQIGTIAGIVRNQANAPISGATVTCGAVTATTNTSGAYSMQVQAGTHTVTAAAQGYATGTQTGVVVVTGQTTTVNFQLAPAADLLTDGFESYENFALLFAPWTLVDVDQSTTYGMTGITWPNAYAAMAYMIFVPSAATPAVTDAEPHGGIKQAACFASTTPPNNDWLITPQLNGADQFKFWARSYTAQYGLERFKVGVSTTGTNPANFTIISGTNYIEAPVDWTEYTYDVSSYGRTPIYIGIQCLSNDAFIFFVDDVLVTGGSPNDDPNAPVVATVLNDNYPNPFNPETTISYSVKEASPVTIEIYNVKGQLVKTLVNDTKDAGNHTVVWRGVDNSNRSVSSGVYYYKMTAGKYSSTKKMILMK
jgi:hypothetical protein